MEEFKIKCRKTRECTNNIVLFAEDVKGYQDDVLDIKRGLRNKIAHEDRIGERLVQISCILGKIGKSVDSYGNAGISIVNLYDRTENSLVGEVDFVSDVTISEEEQINFSIPDWVIALGASTLSLSMPIFYPLSIYYTSKYSERIFGEQIQIIDESMVIAGWVSGLGIDIEKWLPDLVEMSPKFKDLLPGVGKYAKGATYFYSGVPIAVHVVQNIDEGIHEHKDGIEIAADVFTDLNLDLVGFMVATGAGEIGGALGSVLGGAITGGAGTTAGPAGTVAGGTAGVVIGKVMGSATGSAIATFAYNDLIDEKIINGNSIRDILHDGIERDLEFKMRILKKGINKLEELVDNF